jgi:hypothetical protein
MLIKGEEADNIVLADTFTWDGFDHNAEGHKWTFDSYPRMTKTIFILPIAMPPPILWLIH